MPDPCVLAIDIGGTKIEAALTDRRGAVRGRTRAETPQDVGAEELFDVVASVAERARADGAGVPVAVGVGCGGPMRGTGQAIAVSPLNIPAWVDFPLARRLAKRLDIPSKVDNDAKALALGEGWTGAARGVRDYIAMVVSTGVGGGIVLDGRLLDGADGNAGHIGHVIVEPDGRPCGCGARGCLEAEASGTAIAALTGRPAVQAPPEIRARTGRLVGRAVASVANLLDLRLACVAGSVALGFGDVFMDAARAEVAASACMDFSRGTEIRFGALGDEGPLVGAAALGWALVDHPPPEMA